jgi:hypothetical protein
MISAKQLLASEHKREDSRKEYYKALLEQFCRKIKVASERGSKSTVLTVPTFLIGFPRYDIMTTVRYMCRQLQRLGYQVGLVGPLDINVQWSKTSKLETEIQNEELDPGTFLPSLVNLQKTAQKLRGTKKGS